MMCAKVFGGLSGVFIWCYYVWADVGQNVSFSVSLCRNFIFVMALGAQWQAYPMDLLAKGFEPNIWNSRMVYYGLCSLALQI